jgi:hypothetical protein
MNHPLAQTLIQALTRAELRAARRWLTGPGHPRRQGALELFDYLAAAACRGSLASQEAAWAALYPDQPYNDQQLRLLLSYLLRSLERFLALRELEGDAFLPGRLLLQAYRRRKLPRHFAHALHRAKKHLDHQPWRHPEYLLAQYDLEQEHYQLQSAEGRTREFNLQEQEIQLTGAFLAMKLRQACFLLAHQAVFNTPYQVELEEELLALAARPPYAELPAIAVYRNGFRALRSPEQEDLFAPFRQQLMESLNSFPREELRDLFLLGINLCIRNINRNREAFLREALELYRSGIEAEVLVEEGRLSRFTYHNAIGIALRLGELDWAEQFLHRYRPLLEPEQQAAAFSLNAARLSFARRDFGQALLDLQQADYKDLINNLVAKTLQLKIYYELDEFGLLESHLKAMQAFLRRQRRLGYHQQNYRNITHFAARLLALPPGDKAARQKLRAAIEQAEPLTEKEWLMEKVMGG